MRGSQVFRWNGKLMKSRRTELGISLADIADEIGTSRGYLWQIEDGCEPSIGFAYHISQILKKPLSFFVREC